MLELATRKHPFSLHKIVRSCNLSSAVSTALRIDLEWVKEAHGNGMYRWCGPEVPTPENAAQLAEVARRIRASQGQSPKGQPMPVTIPVPKNEVSNGKRTKTISILWGLFKWTRSNG